METEKTINDEIAERVLSVQQRLKSGDMLLVFYDMLIRTYWLRHCEHVEGLVGWTW